MLPKAYTDQRKRESDSRPLDDFEPEEVLPPKKDALITQVFGVIIMIIFAYIFGVIILEALGVIQYKEHYAVTSVVLDSNGYKIVHAEDETFRFAPTDALFSLEVGDSVKIDFELEGSRGSSIKKTVSKVEH